MKRKSMAAYLEDFSDDSARDEAGNQDFEEDMKAMIAQDGEQSSSGSSDDDDSDE